MAEFVEQRLGIVEREQRGLAGRGLGEIHRVEDDRRDAGAVQRMGLAQIAHPGAGALGGPVEIVANEQRHRCAALGDLPGARILVVERDALDRLELQAEEPVRHIEGRSDDILQRQIGLQFRLIDGEAVAALALGIEAPVPGLQRPAEPVGLGAGLQIRLASFSARARAGAQTRERSPSTASGVSAISGASLKAAKVSKPSSFARSERRRSVSAMMPRLSVSAL